MSRGGSKRHRLWHADADRRVKKGTVPIIGIIACMPTIPALRVAVRHRVVAFTVSLAALTYLDRVAISVVAPSIMRDFSLTQIQMSYVFSAFALAYALFEVPTAWWADRVGSRRVVALIVTWWSAFTVLTGAAWGYVSLIAIRFLFGAGEAGAWPNATRVFSRWIPAGERGMVQGIFFSGAHLSGGLAPFLVTVMSEHFHWRTIFAIIGSLGAGGLLRDGGDALIVGARPLGSAGFVYYFR